MADLKLAVTEFKNTVAPDAAESRTKSGINFFKPTKDGAIDLLIGQIDRMNMATSNRVALETEILQYIIKNARLSGVFADKYWFVPPGYCVALAAADQWLPIRNLLWHCKQQGAAFDQNGVAYIKTLAGNYVKSFYYPSRNRFYLAADNGNAPFVSADLIGQFPMAINPRDLATLRGRGVQI